MKIPFSPDPFVQGRWPLNLLLLPPPPPWSWNRIYAQSNCNAALSPSETRNFGIHLRGRWMAETRRHALARNDAAISGIMVISATPAWLIAIRTRSPRREMIQFDRISRFLGTSREKFTPSHPGIAAARYSAGFLEFPTCVYLLPIFSPPRRVSTERATPKLRSSRDVRNRCWLRWLSSSFRSQLLPSRYQRTNFVMCVYIYIYMCVCVLYVRAHLE